MPSTHSINGLSVTTGPRSPEVVDSVTTQIYEPGHQSALSVELLTFKEWWLVNQRFVGIYMTEQGYVAGHAFYYSRNELELEKFHTDPVKTLDEARVLAMTGAAAVVDQD